LGPAACCQPSLDNPATACLQANNEGLTCTSIQKEGAQRRRDTPWGAASIFVPGRGMVYTLEVEAPRVRKNLLQHIERFEQTGLLPQASAPSDAPARRPAI
jgi:hypothetical protein